MHHKRDLRLVLPAATLLAHSRTALIPIHLQPSRPLTVTPTLYMALQSALLPDPLMTFLKQPFHLVFLFCFLTRKAERCWRKIFAQTHTNAYVTTQTKDTHKQTRTNTNTSIHIHIKIFTYKTCTRQTHKYTHAATHTHTQIHRLSKMPTTSASSVASVKLCTN